MRTRAAGSTAIAAPEPLSAGQVLVGRAWETQQIADVVAEGRIRRSALLLLGDAGVGKSSLLAQGAVYAAELGSACIRVSGEQSEVRRDFETLRRLLEPLGDVADELPDDLRSAWTRALSGEVGVDPVSLRNAVRAGLARSAAQQPLVLVIDDVQHSDRDSLDVLRYALRRLGEAPVAVLMAARSWVVPGGVDPGTPTLEVVPLTDVDAARLLDQQDEPPAGWARGEVLRRAEGNPLALVELGRGLAVPGPDAWRDGELAVTGRIEALYAEQLLRLPAATRRALLRAAVGSAHDDLGTLLAAGGAGDALSAAEDAGLISVWGDQVTFRHPLIRAACYAQASVDERLQAHRDLAGHHAAGSLSRAWHLALAQSEPEERVAQDLEAAAEASLSRAGFFESARVLERAAAASPAPQDAARRYAKAAFAAYRGGDAHWVHELYLRVESLTNHPEWSGVAGGYAAHGLTGSGQPLSAFELCERAMLHRPDDRGIAGVIIAAASSALADSGSAEHRRRVPGLLALAACASTSSPLGDAMCAPQTARDVLAFLRAVADPAVVLQPEFRAALSAPTELGEPEIGSLLSRGSTWWWADEPLAAIVLFRQGLDLARTSGRLAMYAQTFVAYIMTALDLGRWDEAAAALTEISDLAAVGNQTQTQVRLETSAASLEVLRGDPVQAGQQLGRLQGRVVECGENVLTWCLLQRSAGAAATAAGDPEGALAHYRAAFTADGEPLHYWFSPRMVAELAAAAVSAGRPQVARPIVARIVQLSEGSASPRLAFQLDVARGLLADGEDAEQWFASAVGADVASAFPYEHAVAQVHYAALLHRRRRYDEERRLLSAALERFTQLGARHAAAAARTELRAVGVSHHQPESAGWTDLTAQQQQIARFAAQGLRNRDIGELMSLSPRTVGSHLYNIYPRLGVSGRQQLRSVVAGL